MKKFQYQVKKAPAAIREYYDSKLKWTEAGSCEQKAEFVRKVLECQSDFTSKYFQTIEQMQEVTRGGTNNKWIPHQEALAKYGDKTLAAIVEQRTIEVRPSKQLKQDHPSTLELPSPARKEYRATTEYEDEGWQHDKTVQKSTDETPPAEAPSSSGSIVVEQPNDAGTAVCLRCQKCQKAYNSVNTDFVGRIDFYSGNKNVREHQCA